MRPFVSCSSSRHASRRLPACVLLAAALGSFLLFVPRPAQAQDLQLRERRQTLVPREDTPSKKRVRGVHYKVNAVPGGHTAVRRGASPNVSPDCNSPHLTYFDGPVITNVQPIPVFWNSFVNGQTVAQMPQFLADISVSSYFTVLSQYSTFGSTLGQGGTNQPVLTGTGSLIAGVTLQPSRCQGSGSCTLTDDQIQSELNTQIAAGNLPAPTYDAAGNDNTVYMIYFPPLVTVEGPDGAGESCEEFCAYHNTGTYSGTGSPLVYGVLMDQYTTACADGCGANPSDFDNMTDTSSHELAEAITDADIGLDQGNDYALPAAWGDNNNSCGEIADICDAYEAGDILTVNGRQWNVQELWSNLDKKCESSGTPYPAQPFSLASNGAVNAGTPINFSLTAQNPDGSTNASYVGTVHFTSSDSSATLPKDYTFTSADQGIHTFSATLNSAGTDTVTATDTSDLDLTGSGTDTVKATPTLSWLTPAAITYGTALSATQLDASTSVAGSFVYTPQAGTVLQAGMQTLSVTFTPTNTAQYSTATASVSLTVNKATPTLSWPTPASIASGTALSATQLDATAQVAGTFAYNPPSGTVLSAGAHTLAVTFTPADTADYTTATASVQLTVTTVTVAALTSPAPGSTLSGSSVTFSWTAATGATTYALNLGSTGANSSNLYNSGHVTATSTTATGLPTNGETIYAELWAYVSNKWVTTNYTYTAFNPAAALTTPTPGSTLAGTTVTFSWNPAVGATVYALNLGSTGAGSSNVYNSGHISATSATVTGLPLNGETIYAELWAFVKNAWVTTNYTYKAGSPTVAALTSPPPSSTLSGSTVTFSWTPATGATAYALNLGSTGAGSSNLYNSGHITATSATVSTLPINSETIYAELWAFVNNKWVTTNYTYTAASPTVAALTSPPPGSMLSGSTVTFSWTPATGATVYALNLGSTGAGSSNLYNSGHITATSATATGLPTNGEPIYAELWSYVKNAWVTTNYIYEAQ
jgi:hypothetical protein